MPQGQWVQYSFYLHTEPQSLGLGPSVSSLSGISPSSPTTPYFFPLQSQSLIIWPSAHLPQFRPEKECSPESACSPIDFFFLQKLQIVSMDRGVLRSLGSSSISHPQREWEKRYLGGGLNSQKKSWAGPQAVHLFSKVSHCPQVPCKPKVHSGFYHSYSLLPPALGFQGLRPVPRVEMAEGSGPSHCIIKARSLTAGHSRADWLLSSSAALGDSFRRGEGATAGQSQAQGHVASDAGSCHQQSRPH